VSSNQNDLNSIINSGNYSASSNTDNLGSAYEFYINYISKIDGTPYALIVRPSYFTQSTTGTGTGWTF